MNSFKFPLVAFSKSGVDMARNENDIFVCSKSALKDNFYKHMRIIDSSGILYEIDNAKMIKGHGFFGGYNIFFSQKIEVELIISSQSKIDIIEFKSLITSGLKKNFLDSGGNYRQIINQINSYNSIDSIISFLTRWYFNE